MSRDIVINTCFGGFSLSAEAVMAYGKRKGLTVWTEPHPRCADIGLATYWLVPKERRVVPLDGMAWINASEEERIASNKAYSEQTISNRDMPRDDPDLIAVVRELGDKANGSFAKLSIVSIPSDVKWTIEEYDGNEHIAEEHRTWR